MLLDVGGGDQGGGVDQLRVFLRSAKKCYNRVSTRVKRGSMNGVQPKGQRLRARERERERDQSQRENQSHREIETEIEIEIETRRMEDITKNQTNEIKSLNSVLSMI